jgi:hypothetical protein
MKGANEPFSLSREQARTFLSAYVFSSPTRGFSKEGRCEGIDRADKNVGALRKGVNEPYFV